jgi:hypothetical protein
VIAGTYSVTITDQNGCTDSSSITVTEPVMLMASSVVDSNITCNSQSDGGATVSSIGGTMPYTYSWSNSATTASITGVIAGTYSVTITDANGCTDSASTTITEPAMLMASSVVDSNVTCNSLSDGGATVSSIGGTMPYTYAWSNSATTASITGVIAGTYSVTITDANGCTDSASTTITEPAMLMASSVIDSNVTCNSLSDGGATASSVGGTMPYLYAWSNSDTTAFITGVIAGTYNVTITDANGCTDSTSAMVIEPSILVAASVVDSNTTCNGIANGGATSSSTGGTMPYTYSWSNVATTASITGVIAGTYSVTITDVNGCTDSSSTIVTEPGLLVATAVTDSNTTMFGASDGGVSSSAAGGTMPYTYSWSNSATTASMTGVIAGTYSVTITDANGCTDSSSTAVTQPPALGLSIAADSNVSCFGLADGGATAIPVGGTLPYSYLWSTTDTTTFITGMVAGTYSLTITDGASVIAVSSITITEPNALVSTIQIDSNVSCFGLLDGGLTSVVTGGISPYSYAWNDSNSAAIIDTTAFIDSLSVGVYTVIITDSNGCTSVSSDSLFQPVVLDLVIAIDSNVSCFGSSDGGMTSAITGGVAPYNYLWSNSDTTASITSLAAGIYSLTVEDANGCTIGNVDTIIEPLQLVSTIVVDSNVSCNGLANGGVTVIPLGGTMPYAYAWSNSDTTASITGVIAGTFSVTITDGNGCLIIDTVIITEPIVLTSAIGSSSNVTCFGDSTGTANVIGSGGTLPYSYLWPLGDTTALNTMLPAGVHIVTITDANGCMDTSSVTITQNNPLLAFISSTTNQLCYGDTSGAISALAGGGVAPYSYVWSNGDTTSSLTGLVVGSYVLTVTDALGCTQTTNTSITQPTQLSAQFVNVSNSTCFGSANGTAEVLTFGGTSPYNYYWSNGTTTSMNTGMDTGYYSIIITDTNNCTFSDSVLMTQPDSLMTITSVDTNVLCFGGNTGEGSAVTTGGTLPYVYSWSNGTNGTVATGLFAGTHTVTVSDANNCTSVDTISITQPTSIVSVVVTGTNASCFAFTDGTSSAIVTGGTAPYTYLWSTLDTTSNIVNIAAGSHMVTVTDTNGCSVSDTVLITEPTQIIVTTSIIANVSCFGGIDGQAQVLASGGSAPYVYLWNNADTTIVIDSLVAGVYNAVVTDANGCIDSNNVTITEPVLLTIDLGPDTTICTNEVIVLDAGVSFTSYNWDNGDTIQTRTVDAAIVGVGMANYYVTVQDTAGCEANDSILVTVGGPFSTTITMNGDSALCEYEDITLDAGPGFASYLWSNTSSMQLNTIYATNWPTGMNVYTVTVTDTNGCTAEASDSIFIQPEVIIDLGPDTVVWQNNLYTLDAGSQFATYTWSFDGSTNQTFDVTTANAGNHSVVVTDSITTCEGTDDVNVKFTLDISSLIEPSVKIYPNPTLRNNKSFRIEVKNMGLYEVVIRDLAGKLIFHGELSDQPVLEIDTHAFEAGAYLIEVSGGSYREIHKMVVL